MQFPGGYVAEIHCAGEMTLPLLKVDRYRSQLVLLAMRASGLSHDEFSARTHASVSALPCLLAGSLPAFAEDEAKRPEIKTNRWQEDWSALADPALRTEWYDPIKYIPIHARRSAQLHLVRDDAPRALRKSSTPRRFGTAGTKPDNYLIQRLQFHADVHFDEHWQLFVQVEDDRAFGKNVITPVDQDPLDIRLGFLAYVNTTDAGTFKGRVGRQDFDFDLQRFVSSRDGPNVRQSFDAVWGDWESGPWRFIGFLSQPVQYDLDVSL